MPSRTLISILLLAVTWFSMLGYRPLTETDEGRYAEIPREMLRSGDFLTPRLAGFLYFEKPPLQYWATAAALSLLGLTERAARLWPALTGALGVAAVWFSGRRLFGASAGNLAALALASMLLYFGVAHVNTLDMGVAAFLGVALVAFCLAQSRRDEAAANRNYMLLTWAAMGLAVLSKGLIGVVLPALTVAVYLAATRDFAILRRLHPLKGLALFLAIAAPWFVAVSLKHPAFPRFFFIREHFERFAETGHDRTEPVWYIPAALLGGVLPWILYALPPLVRLRRSGGGGFSAPALLRAWAWVVPVFFAVSQSKMLGYVTPALPAIALLAGAEMERAGPRRLRLTIGLTALAGTTAAVLCFFVPRLGTLDATPAMLRLAIPWLAGAAGTFLAGAALSLLLGRRGDRAAAFGALAFTWIAALQLTLAGSIGFSEMHSTAKLARDVRPHLAPDMPIYTLGCYDQSLPFYLDRTLTLVRRKSEMRFGIEQEPWKWVPDWSEFGRRWKSGGPAMAVLAEKDLGKLGPLGIEWREIARGHRRVVIVNR